MNNLRRLVTVICCSVVVSLSAPALAQDVPPAMQAEVDELLTIAGSSVGLMALVGLTTPWATATAEQIQSALRGMRDSSLAPRQQAYHALRDLTSGGYFADESTWAVMDYAGQRPV